MTTIEDRMHELMVQMQELELEYLELLHLYNKGYRYLPGEYTGNVVPFERGEV